MVSSLPLRVGQLCHTLNRVSRLTYLHISELVCILHFLIPVDQLKSVIKWQCNNVFIII